MPFGGRFSKPSTLGEHKDQPLPQQEESSKLSCCSVLCEAELGRLGANSQSETGGGHVGYCCHGPSCFLTHEQELEPADHQPSILHLTRWRL